MAEQDMKNRLELVGLEVQYFINTIEKHTEVLSRSPEVRDYIECCIEDRSLNPVYKLKVALLFKALLSTYPECSQARILNINTGKEMIRVNKDERSIRIVPENELQIKKDRDYFKESLVLNDNEYYLSPFDLNREHGQLTIPYVKTIRVATPLVDSLGSKLAILIINVNASYWFNHLKSYQSDKDSVFLLDEKGVFLFHPDDLKSFSTYKFGSRHSISSFDQMITPYNNTTSETFLRNELGGREYFILPRTYTYGNSNSHKITMIGSLQKGLLFKEVRSKINIAIFLAAGALVVGILLLYFLARNLVKPVRKLSGQVKLYVPGNQIPEFETGRQDEIGSLGVRFKELAGKVNQQLKDLKKEKIKAEKAAQDKEAFLANFSHELRTPLNSIAGMTEVLKHNKHLDSQEPIIETLKYSVQYLQALISNVLDYTRILEDKIWLTKDEVIVEELLKNLVMSHQLKARSKNIFLKYEADPNVPVAVITDKMRLVQILNNLLSNAITFTDKGGVNISVSWEEPDELKLVINDTGHGMDEDELKDIFHRYHQAGEQKRAGTGVGLGLAITDHLVTMLKGRITVESKINEGSRFSVVLPVEQGGDTLQKADAEQEVYKDIRVLYVDDVLVNRTTMQHLLDPTGIQLVVVSCCDEALVEIQKNDFDVVLMDLRMPETDGFACIDKIREVKDGNPFIAVSANLGDEEINSLTALGITDFIEKPINRAHLLSKIVALKEGIYKGIYDDLMEKYCNNDPVLLRKLLDDLTGELYNSMELLDATIQETRSEQEAEEFVKEIRHKLKPAIIMFGQFELMERIIEKQKDPVEGMKLVVEELIGFAEEFKKAWL